MGTWNATPQVVTPPDATETLGLHAPLGCAGDADTSSDWLVWTVKSAGLVGSGVGAPVFFMFRSATRKKLPFIGTRPPPVDATLVEPTVSDTPALPPPLLLPEPPLLPPPSAPVPPPPPLEHATTMHGATQTNQTFALVIRSSTLRSR